MADESQFADRLFKRLTNRKWEEWTRTQSLESFQEELEDRLFTKYPLLYLGMADENLYYLAEEERNHIHILGKPGQGKSMFLQICCRHDIDRLINEETAPGFCLIDSSDFGGTFDKVLRYCRYVGFKKVCIIDPNDIRGPIGKIATINIFGRKFFSKKKGKLVYGRSKGEVAAAIHSIFQVLWNVEDFSKTANIDRALELVSNVLYEAGGTLTDAQFFKVKSHPLYQAKRDAIIGQSHPLDASRVELEDLFFKQPPNVFNDRFGSTINRMAPAFKADLPLMFGSADNTINFAKLIAEGWIILVNADPHKWPEDPRKLLGTVIINEIINGIYALVARGYKRPFRLYIDEVGRYASKTLVELINYKRTSQIHLVGTHQQLKQVENKAVAAALMSAPIKMTFALDRDDREQMFKNMYWGEMDKQASDAFHALRKQHAVIQAHDRPATKVRLVDLEEIEKDDELDLAFKTKLYQHPWYKTRKEINNEINARFVRQRPADGRPEFGGAGGAGDNKRDNRKSTGKRPVRNAGPAVKAGPAKPISKTHFD